MRMRFWVVTMGFVATSLWGNVARSATLFAVNVEPIIGFERVQKLVPNPHSKNRLIYGARVRAGIPLVSAEGEYTRGTDQENFPTEDLSIKDTTDQLKIGLRSGLDLSKFFNLSARAGVQASQNKHEETRVGVTVISSEPRKYRPYAGLGARAGLSSKISATADVVVVFNDINDLSKNEYQTTAGFSIRFP